MGICAEPCMGTQATIFGNKIWDSVYANCIGLTKNSI